MKHHTPRPGRHPLTLRRVRVPRAIAMRRGLERRQAFRWREGARSNTATQGTDTSVANVAGTEISEESLLVV